jgi:hypothetical protein
MSIKIRIKTLLPPPNGFLVSSAKIGASEIVLILPYFCSIKSDIK